jgi:hypothetical protein
LARLLEHSPRPESIYQPTWAVVFGKAENMRDSDRRKNKADSAKQITGLPIVQHNVAGIDLGSERHWVCAPTLEEGGREVADFGATTCELIRMLLGNLLFAMGSTGSLLALHLRARPPGRESS